MLFFSLHLEFYVQLFFLLFSFYLQFSSSFFLELNFSILSEEFSFLGEFLLFVLIIIIYLKHYFYDNNVYHLMALLMHILVVVLVNTFLEFLKDVVLVLLNQQDNGAMLLYFVQNLLNYYNYYMIYLYMVLEDYMDYVCHSKFLFRNLISIIYYLTLNLLNNYFD